MQLLPFEGIDRSIPSIGSRGSIFRSPPFYKRQSLLVIMLTVASYTNYLLKCTGKSVPNVVVPGSTMTAAASIKLNAMHQFGHCCKLHDNGGHMPSQLNNLLYSSL